MSAGADALASEVPPPGERFNLAAHLLDANAARPDKLAFVDDVGALRYGALADRVRRLATAFGALGLRREQRVLLFLLDTTDWPVVFLAAQYAGLVPVPVNTLLTADDVAYLLEHSRAQAVVVSGALVPVVAAAMIKADHEVGPVIVARPAGALPEGAHALDALIAAHPPRVAAVATGADEPAFWLYSSGSTGRPKGTVHTHANPYWTIELYGKRILGLTADDVCFSAAKLFFAYGLGNALTFPMSVGATTVLMPERPTPEATIARWLGATAPQREHGVVPTVFYGAPTGFAGLLACAALPARDQVRLRLVSSAGEALPASVGERFRDHFGVDIVDGIGSTEMLHIFLSNRPGDVRYGTTGWPVPGYTLELRGDDGQPVPDGEPGDLYIAGPSAALLYWGNRARTRETFQGGWTKSGDKYVRNPDGTYTYGGRSDDMLKVSGVYVSPFEVEATLMLHPAVLEAAVIGVPDRDGLTKTKAFVVLRAGGAVTEAELKAFVKDRLAPYNYPRQIAFVEDLPKTATGKIQRYKLREREAAR